VSSFNNLDVALRERREQHLYRHCRQLQSAQGPLLEIDGKSYLGFCSNDYLGHANHPQVVKAFKQAADRYGVGSGASHLVCGHSEPHHQLEEALAELTGRPRALLFSTGYMANIGTVNALLGRGDAVFEDRLNHASLLDAGLSSGAAFKRFPHADCEALEQQLIKADASRKLVLTDAVFSMDGDMAPLPAMAELCRKQDAWLMADDAHGLGVLGKSGAGTLECFGLDVQQVPVLMGTLGKALGTAGAFVAGSETLVETLVQFARTYIYTTAMPPAVAAATLASVRLLRDESWRREHLRDLIAHFRQGADQLGLSLMDSETAIQPLLVGEAERALEISTKLEDRGILISAIRPPTVPANTARLRITLSAAHSEQQVDGLLEALAEVIDD
jgi:8-amino-7-oxononanoate synthase